ncbi:keratin, type I cytoskeletal 10-like [Hyperolius riggenbachi]|uniref:keratin, type I cytoskeletal 10-like n=1 Tax=Hyperolius riggenbachi TaxID=752182 RepID=UPI0035A2E32B
MAINSQKYENELHMWQQVEADLNGLRKVMDELTSAKSDLELQVESLTEELTSLKKNHEEDTKSTQETSVGQVNVEMDAAPGNDLTKKLNDMRAQYEAMAEKNRKAAEDWFNQVSAQLSKEISAGAQETQVNTSEITELKRTLQSLEMELQAQYAMKKNLEDSLAQTEGNYCMQISQIQANISTLEAQLEEMKEEVMCQKQEYETLLDVKTQLENEIKTYQDLLEKGDAETGSGQDASHVDTKTGSRAQISQSSASRTPASTTQASRSTPTQSSSSTAPAYQSSASSSQRSSTSPSSASCSSASAGQSSSSSATSGAGSGRYGGQSSSSYGSGGHGGSISGGQSSDAVKTKRKIVTETYIDGNMVDSKTEEYDV